MWISEAFKLPKFFIEIFSEIVGFSFFCFNFFEDLPINCIESFRSILIGVVARAGEIVPDIESKAVLFYVFFAHLIFVH